jgi:hypothetical protein
MASLVYILCALTSLMCSIALLRGYRGSRGRLLLWSGSCFALLFIENVLLFLDVVVFPNVNLAPLRNAVGLLGPSVLLFGLISEAE